MGVAMIFKFMTEQDRLKQKSFQKTLIYPENGRNHARIAEGNGQVFSITKFKLSLC